MKATKRPAAPLTSYVDAPAFKKLGYYTLPIEPSQIDLGHEEPSGGGWAWPFCEPTDPENYHIGIHAGVMPHNGGGGMSMEDCAKTWLAVLRVTGFTNDRTVKAIEAVLAPIVGSGPVRETFGNLDLLIPFRVDVRVNLQTRSVGEEVMIKSGPVCFVANGAPWYWRRNVDLSQVHQDDLPLLDLNMATDLLSAVDDVIYEHRDTAAERAHAAAQAAELAAIRTARLAREAADIEAARQAHETQERAEVEELSRMVGTTTYGARARLRFR